MPEVALKGRPGKPVLLPAEAGLRPEALPWATLLTRFYRRAGRSFPELRRLKGTEVPEPYRALLVHSNDMTPTLECFHGQPLSLRVLSRESVGREYLREVTLNLAESGTPVEYGAIRIQLDVFPEAARERILEEQTPLGKILELESIPHVGWPQAFFRMRADERVAEHLGVEAGREVYGRRNVLLDGHRRMLAEVIEILPPVG